MPTQGPVELWKTSSWSKFKAFGTEQDAFWSVRAMGDALLGAGMQDGWLRTYDLSTGELLRSVKAHDEEVNDIAFSPDSQSLVTASNDKTAKSGILTLCN
jgi:WD40 repeat protein